MQVLCPRPYAGFFSRGGGGKIIYNRGGKQVPPPTRGAFAYLRLKLNDLVHTLGGFFLNIFNKKRKKKIHIHGICVFILTLG